jgi:hypothetical protein
MCAVGGQTASDLMTFQLQLMQLDLCSFKPKQQQLTYTR